MTNKEKIEILDENINAIERNEYRSEIESFSFVSYSPNITSIFKILKEKDYNELYIQNFDDYDKKYLEQQVDPSTYSLVECIIYFNWLWYVEGSGLATGIIGGRIRDGRYLKALKRFKEILELEDKYNIEIK